MKEEMISQNKYNEQQVFNRKLKEKRIERVRNLKMKDTAIPKIKGKLWASRIIDEVNSNDKEDGFPIPDCNNERCYLPPIQKQRTDEYCIIGTDVKALFPSLKDEECARMTRCAIMNIEIKFENINYKKAQRYLKKRVPTV